MEQSLLFDLVILALLVGFAIYGASRGLVLSLCGLVAILLSFGGAWLLANAGAPIVARYLEPRFQIMIEQHLEEQLATVPQAPNSATGAELAPSQISLDDVLGVLKEMGLYEELVTTIEQAVESGMTQLAANAVAAVAAAIAQSVAYTAIFALTSVIISVLWSIISHVLDLVTHLPVLYTLNRVGGALFGILKCGMLLFLSAWVLRYFGNLIPEETVEQTRLLKFFLTTNPLTLIVQAFP